MPHLWVVRRACHTRMAMLQVEHGSAQSEFIWNRRSTERRSRGESVAADRRHGDRRAPVSVSWVMDDFVKAPIRNLPESSP